MTTETHSKAESAFEREGRREAPPKQDPKNLVWMDLEMTGLDPHKEKILEIATLITNSELEIIAEGPSLVIHQPPKVLKAMDEWNQRQHKKSGLLELVQASKIVTENAERQTLDFIRKYCPIHASPLCGNSIHHDRRFLIHHMPLLSQYLHYRHVDVTTVKALVHRWYPKAKQYPKKNENHRALQDILDSIQELKFLRENYFVKAGESA